MRFFIALVIGALLSVCTGTVLASEDCNSLVGKSFFVEEDRLPPLGSLSFREERKDGDYFSQTLPVGQKFQITALSTPYLTVLTQDGRQLEIACPMLLMAMEPDFSGQRVVQSDAKDYSEVLAARKAKQDEAQRKRKALDARLQHEATDRVAQRMARGGVRIGMNEDQVLASSWGEPDKRNHTIVAGGDSEQWEYGHQYFLYFTNGLLTGVQTDSPDRGYFQVAK